MANSPYDSSIIIEANNHLSGQGCVNDVIRCGSLAQYQLYTRMDNFVR